MSFSETRTECEDSEALLPVAAEEQALARHARPGIFNTDQGARFTSAAFTRLL